MPNLKCLTCLTNDTSDSKYCSTKCEIDGLKFAATYERNHAIEQNNRADEWRRAYECVCGRMEVARGMLAKLSKLKESTEPELLPHEFRRHIQEVEDYISNSRSLG